MLAQQYADDKEKVALLKALWQYAEEIVYRGSLRRWYGGGQF